MSIFNYAAEAIAFQGTEFAEQLTEQFEKILQYKTPKEAASSDERKNVEKLINKRTGLNIKLSLDTMRHPCVSVPYVNPGSILLPDFLHGLITDDYEVMVRKIDKNIEDNFVDLKNVKVGGNYSVIETPIFMSFKFLKEAKFTTRECVAFLLHEMGHVFVSYEFTNRVIRTNQIIAAVNKASLSDTTGEKHKHILKTIAKSAKLQDDVFEDLVDIKNSQVISTVVIREVYEGARSELGTKNYDNSTFEALSDQFAARFGFGREAVSGLDKMNRLYGYVEYSQSARTSMAFYETAALFGIPVFAVLSVTVSPWLIGLTLMGFLSVYLSGDSQRDFTYDDLRVRYLRIREQIITHLKDKTLDADTVKHHIESLEKIDKILESVKDYKGPMRAISNFIFSNNRKEMKAIELQRELETMMANDLFVQASKLSFLK